MTFKIDYRDGDVYTWSVTNDGDVQYTKDTNYTPSLYVSAEDTDALDTVRSHLSTRSTVASMGREQWRTVWRNDPEPVLRIDATTLEALEDLAHEIRGWGSPSEYQLFNVDFSREFRYCIETGVEPTPPESPSLSTLELTLPPKNLNDTSIEGLTVAGEQVTESEPVVLDAVTEALDEQNPDVLVMSSGELVPLLYNKAERYDRSAFELGRLPGWQRLASESTFESYGQVSHSPARYNVYGRAIIDTASSFFWSQTNLEGVLDLVARSWKPLQETAWASIGNVLTSIQIREAFANDVLVPWNSWRHEYFKSMNTLHDADRGGFIFAPDVGFHENVHELDFSSLYPNIMITRNVSPDTIRCECHSHRDDVPGLGYSICDDRGFLLDVLEPIITDREEYKAKLADTECEATRERLQGRSDALKWILVSCFGYQGFSNAKFGRIECHEAINAYAREILLDSKEIFEQHGWRVVHGIVDSIWVQAIPDETQTPIRDVAEKVTSHVGITLEYEANYDWIAFVPRKDSDEGALNRYFGKVADADEFKKRGIELRQRSTPDYIKECQTEWLQTLDDTRKPGPVCDALKRHLATLRAGDVDPERLLIQRRVSKQLDDYSHYTRSVAALERAATHDFDVPPGEDVEYVVVDDDRASAARVNLAYEDLDRYDTDFYAELLIRAAESVLSPFGWDRVRIKQYLAESTETTLASYQSVS